MVDQVTLRNNLYPFQYPSVHIPFMTSPCTMAVPCLGHRLLAQFRVWDLRIGLHYRCWDGIRLRSVLLVLVPHTAHWSSQISPILNWSSQRIAEEQRGTSLRMEQLRGTCLRRGSHLSQHQMRRSLGLCMSSMPSTDGQLLLGILQLRKLSAPQPDPAPS